MIILRVIDVSYSVFLPSMQFIFCKAMLFCLLTVSVSIEYREDEKKSSYILKCYYTSYSFKEKHNKMLFQKERNTCKLKPK